MNRLWAGRHRRARQTDLELIRKPPLIVTLSEAKGLGRSEIRRQRQRFFAALRMTSFSKEVSGWVLPEGHGATGGRALPGHG